MKRKYLIVLPNRFNHSISYPQISFSRIGIGVQRRPPKPFDLFEIRIEIVAEEINNCNRRHRWLHSSCRLPHRVDNDALDFAGQSGRLLPPGQELRAGPMSILGRIFRRRF